jgi:hypothetical protein
MMRFDKSLHTIVVTCSDCGNLYGEIAFTLDEAARLSSQHERHVHGISIGKTQGYGIAYQRTRRGTQT